MIGGGRRSSREDGFALLSVLGGMLALTLVVLAVLSYVVTSMPLSRRGQDAAAALQAAQAGIDDYLGRLASCDAYWQTPCAGSGTNVSLTNWATVPGSSSTARAQYTVRVLSTPNSAGGEAGLLRVRSTGRIDVPGTTKDVKRSIVVDLRKRSLLDYIYYTDKEALSPSALQRVVPTTNFQIDPNTNSGYNAVRRWTPTDAEAQKCARYHYATTTSPARPVPGSADQIRRLVQGSKDGGATWVDVGYEQLGSSSGASGICDIQFTSIDVIDGPAYSQDALLLHGTPLFKGPVSTRWAAGSSPAPNPSAWYRKVTSASAPHTDGYKPAFANEDVKLPASNSTIKDRTGPGQGGCPYTGPTRIVLRDNGTMDVTSPLTRATNAPCTRGTATSPGLSAAQNVPIPANGVVYVSRSTETCSGRALGTYPVSGDVTPYDCAAGTVFLEGTLSGRLTIASQDDVVITEDILYKGGLTGTDSLGLVANGEVEVYHPVACSSPPPAGFSCRDDQYANLSTAIDNITISAAILSVQRSFGVQNYWRGARMGTLTVLGGIYQLHRGPVGTGGGSGTGYAKDYRFDKRLSSLPPPSFLDPLAAPWKPTAFAEVKNPSGLPA